MLVNYRTGDTIKSIPSGNICLDPWRPAWEDDTGHIGLDVLSGINPLPGYSYSRSALNYSNDDENLFIDHKQRGIQDNPLLAISGCPAMFVARLAGSVEPGILAWGLHDAFIPSEVLDDFDEYVPIY